MKTTSAKKVASKYLQKVSSYYGQSWPYVRAPLTTPSPAHLLREEAECLEEYAQEVARTIKSSNRGYDVFVMAREEGASKITLTARTPYGLRFSMTYKLSARREEVDHILIFYISKVQNNMNKRLRREIEIPLFDEFGGGTSNSITGISHESLIRKLSSADPLRFLPKKRR